MTMPSRRPALLVSNSAAGSSDDEQVAAVADTLAAAYQVIRFASGGPDDLRSRLAVYDGRHVFVAGGDGSLHLLVNTLSDLDRLDDTVVGLVPMGTANDFATGLGLPDDPVAAAAACLRADPAPLDLIACDDGEVVVNAAHAGLGAVASDRAQGVKPVAGPLAYPLAALAAGATEQGYDLRVTLDDAVIHEGATLMVLAANGPCLGGGARLCTGADPSDGLLDVLVVGELTLTDRTGLAVDIQRGTHLERDDVRQHQGHALRLRGEAIDHSRDGELRHDRPDVTYTIRPGAWTLLRPAG